MKSTSLFQRIRALIALGISAGLFMAQPVYAIDTAYMGMELPKKNPGEEEPATKNKTKSKTSSSRNNHAVKIYPDAIKRDMHVIAKGNSKNEIDFFVFDLQGILVQNFKMKQKDHRKISGLARGKYVYHVFSGDEETASGQFEIR